MLTQYIFVVFVFTLTLTLVSNKINNSINKRESKLIVERLSRIDHFAS